MALDRMNTEAKAPIKIVLERRARPDSQQAFEAWVKTLLTSADGALEGSSVFTAGEETVILLRFASEGALDRWQGSSRVIALLDEGNALSTAPGGAPVIRSGLETWFTLPGAPTLAPPKWKMALVTWCALLPQVIALGFVIPSGLPFPFPAMIGTALPVASLTWLVMPRLTRLLASWLFATSSRHR